MTLREFGEERLEGGRTEVHRVGDTVLRTAGAWSPAVIRLLRHLEAVGYRSAPRVVGNGFAEDGREALSFVPGWSAHPGPWPDDILPRIGTALRRLHTATASFAAPPDAVWQRWFGRDLGGSTRVIGHCDTGPWNILATGDRSAITFIDWETAGPVDPLVDLAHACWLNAQLHDDQIAERQGLAAPGERAHHVRLIVDGYGVAAADRHRLVELMIDVAVTDAAEQARHVTPDHGDGELLWALAWRTRSAAWMIRHRRLLADALR